MAVFHVKAVSGFFWSWFEVYDDSGDLKFRVEPCWWGRSMRIRDHSRQHVGDVIASWMMLIWPEVIRFEWLGSAFLKISAHRIFGRSEYELTLPDGKPLLVTSSFRKLHFFRGDREVATAVKKFWSLDHGYRIKVDEPASAEFILVTVTRLGYFGD
jgi:uncharacterized protein YxjI